MLECVADADADGSESIVRVLVDESDEPKDASYSSTYQLYDPVDDGLKWYVVDPPVDATLFPEIYNSAVPPTLPPLLCDKDIGIDWPRSYVLSGADPDAVFMESP